MPGSPVNDIGAIALMRVIIAANLYITVWSCRLAMAGTAIKEKKCMLN
jgi:hypothetical protein